MLAVAAHAAAGGRAAEGGFHHALEALVAQGASLAGVGKQVLQGIDCDACIQPLLTGASTLV
ncbi:MAG TPA: hypothetical protein VGN24_09040 [Rhodanobacter sp.]|nr:hypothetical protein [Rhodanobacter sp.]